MRSAALHLSTVLLLCASAHARPPERAARPPRAAPPKSGPLPGEAEFNSCVKLSPGRRVKVSLKPGSELKDLVAWISSMTCKSFIVGGSLRSQPVTLTSPTPISAAEAYRAFVSTLSVMGLTVVPTGRFLKVVPAAWGAQSPTRVLGPKEQSLLPTSEEVVTQLLPVRHARVDQLLAALQKMKSAAGDVSAYLPGSMLILTDRADSVRRMVRIVHELDRPARESQIWVVRPRHADPAELARLLGELFAGDGGKGKAAPAQPPAHFVVDAASGALLVQADAGVFRRVEAVIKAVDLESQGAQTRAWVYRLRHGDAASLASELGGLGTGTGASAARTKGRTPGGAASGQAPLFDGRVQITAIKATNSLLVQATARDYLKLRRVIEEVDRPRRQVFIEAYVLEVKLDKDRDVGLALHGGKLFGDNAVLGGVGHGDLTSLSLVPSELMGLAVGVQGKLIDGSALGLGYDLPAFGIALRAMQQDHDIDVLSSPHLLTTDNEEAEILVGENIPQRAGGAALPTSSGGGEQQQQLTLLANLAPTVEHVDVGLQLKLTPTIGEGGAIRLKLEQKVDEVKEKDFGGLGASKYRREIHTTVTVHDRQTVVIGGLIGRRIENGQSKIPLLGDLPIIGRLFRRETKHTVRTNMIVVLTPHIIHDRSDLRRIFVHKLGQREDFIRRYTARRQRLGLSPVDYRYKRGLLAEIDRFGARVEAERRLAAEAREPGHLLEVQQIQ